MQGLVTIDFGNTNPHAGIFQKLNQEWKLIKVVPWSELQIYLTQLEMTPNNSQMVLAEVKSREEELEEYKLQGWLITRVKDYWRGQRFAGLPVNYAQTLGEDRLIQAFYAYKKFKTNTLLIDAGTFVTMDLITKEGFLGGYIFPGLPNYFSIFQMGELLKSVELTQEISQNIPHTTAEAMRDSYFAYAALAQKLTSEHEIQKILVTGGQSGTWKQIFEVIGSSVDVQIDPSLIHWALQFWMVTQIEPL